MSKKRSFYDFPPIKGNPLLINRTENPEHVLFGEKPLDNTGTKAVQKRDKNGTKAVQKRDKNGTKAVQKRDKRRRFTPTKEVEKILTGVEKVSDYINRAVVVFTREEIKDSKL